MQVNNISLTQNLQEITLQGSDLFPMSVYSIIIRDHIYGYIPLHWHDEIQFILVTQGCVKFTVDMKAFILEKNQGLFINTGQLHSARSLHGSDGAFICCEFLPSVLASKDDPLYNTCLRPVTENLEFKAYMLTKKSTWQADLLHSIEDMYKCIDTSDTYKNLKLRSLLSSMWYTFISNIDIADEIDLRTNTGTNDRIKLILEYIHSNFDQTITLSDLGHVSNLSRSRCCKLFKESVECTPFEYINKYRISKSMNLLKHSSLSINEVSFAVGFNTPSYYIHTFKTLVGITPKQYRKKSNAPHATSD